MKHNQKAIARIIPEEAMKIDKRCPGFREELLHAIADILDYERQHRIQGTNIQKQINEKINATGRYLAEQIEQMNHTLSGDN